MILKRLQLKLKEIARSQGRSYSELGVSLGVSEATIKRMLNHSDVGFSKLEHLCSALEVSFFDVLDLSRSADQKQYFYTRDQEEFLARNDHHFLIFRYLIMGKRLEEIQEKLMLKEVQLAKVLKEMEKRDLIERHPSDRIKILANFPFKWIEKGPLELAYGSVLLKRVVKQSLQQGINSENEEAACLVYEWGLTPKSHAQFVKELSGLYEKYKKVAEVEIKSLGDEFIPTSGMISIGRYPMW